MSRFGDNVRKYRKARGLTQKELAEKTGLYDSSSISKIEKGLSDCTSSTIIKLADALGISPSDFFDDHPVTISKAEKTILEFQAKYGETDGTRLVMELIELRNMYKSGLLSKEEFEIGKRFILEMMKK